MKSIREIYKIGKGPSSSHTMGPERAAQLFKKEHPEADSFRVVLFGSLSKTGVGHGTDRVLREVLSPLPTEIVFSHEHLVNSHPNTLDFYAMKNGEQIGYLRVESIGGGDIHIAGRPDISGALYFRISACSMPEGSANGEDLSGENMSLVSDNVKMERYYEAAPVATLFGLDKKIDEEIGDVETAIDNIIAIQNILIGGEGE